MKTHILCSITFFRKSRRLWDNVEKCSGDWGATNDDTIWRIRVVCWISKATCTDAHAHTDKCVILITFPRQQWFSERASLLRYTYFFCLVHIFPYQSFCAKKYYVKNVGRKITFYDCHNGLNFHSVIHFIIYHPSNPRVFFLVKTDPSMCEKGATNTLPVQRDRSVLKENLNLAEPAEGERVVANGGSLINASLVARL
jgi:hypothetical protein